ncbi:MAG: alpha/beta hydrolase [Alphaproteobacteria bacterium]
MASAELQKVIAARRANAYTPDSTIEQLRAETEARGGAPLIDGATHQPASANGVPGEWVDAANAAKDRVFLFLHGGGYYRGSAASSRTTSARISAACGARVYAIDYRLAPEHAFPAAVDDALTAYRWLLDQGIDAGKIAVGGISAGGGLTLALLLRLKETGLPQPAAAFPMSAWTDLTQSGETFVTRADVDPAISKPYLDRMAGLYLAGADPKTPQASPLFGDLTGLPPILVHVGTAETLLDDSRLFAERARAAGVDITYEAWEDMIHGWHAFGDVLPEAREAILGIGEFYRGQVPA